MKSNLFILILFFTSNLYANEQKKIDIKYAQEIIKLIKAKPTEWEKPTKMLKAYSLSLKDMLTVKKGVKVNLDKMLKLLDYQTIQDLHKARNLLYHSNYKDKKFTKFYKSNLDDFDRITIISNDINYSLYEGRDNLDKPSVLYNLIKIFPLTKREIKQLEIDRNRERFFKQREEKEFAALKKEGVDVDSLTELIWIIDNKHYDYDFNQQMDIIIKYQELIDVSKKEKKQSQLAFYTDEYTVIKFHSFGISIEPPRGNLELKDLPGINKKKLEKYNKIMKDLKQILDPSMESEKDVDKNEKYKDYQPKRLDDEQIALIEKKIETIERFFNEKKIDEIITQTMGVPLSKTGITFRNELLTKRAVFIHLIQLIKNKKNWFIVPEEEMIYLLPLTTEKSDFYKDKIYKFRWNIKKKEWFWEPDMDFEKEKFQNVKLF